MPDIWTKYPEIVRRILEEAGFKCGVEPRILARNASETCQFVKENFLGEIYIHKINFVPGNTLLILALGIAIVIIFVLGIFLIRKQKMFNKKTKI